MKAVLLLTLLAMAVGCSSGSKIKAVDVSHFKGTINISENTPYKDSSIIDANIVNECTNLGKKLSKYTSQYGTNLGLKFKASKKPVTKKTRGYSLVVKIENAVSGGNAFLGHHKQVQVRATLYKNGKLIKTKQLSRKSSGGMWGAYKSSCAVLGRTVKTLGSDVAKWTTTVVK